MAILGILHYPNPRLLEQSIDVDEVTEDVKQFVGDMFETMYEAQGIGLAAPQVDVRKRIIVIDISEERNEPLCLINPKITRKEGRFTYKEGCLSVPDIFETVERAQKITLTALDGEGEPLQMEAEDLLAVCIQHEIDHLDGKLFIDYLSTLKKDRIKKKLLKHQRHRA